MDKEQKYYSEQTALNFYRKKMRHFYGGTQITPLSIKGGVVNGDFALQPAFTAATSTSGRWIDGTATGSLTNEDYSWGFSTTTPATGSNAYFDTVGGFKCITVDGKGMARAGANYSRAEVNTTLEYHGATIGIKNQHKLIPVLPNTTYKISADIWIHSCSDTTNVMTQILFTAYGADAVTRITSTASDQLFGTILEQYIPVSKTFTTGATTYYVILSFGTFVTGVDGTDRAMKASVKDFKIGLATSITNSSSSPVLFYPTMTAVDSTDNIDQSAVATIDNTASLGRLATKYESQSFIPTKKYYTGFVFQREPNVGTFVGDITFTLQADSAGKPSGTALATTVIPNATFNAISGDTDYTVPLVATVTPGNIYWAVAESSTADNSNYGNFSAYGTSIYSGGVRSISADGITWTNQTHDLYFKTLYSKNTTNLTVSTDTQTVSVTAPTVDGWENGTVVNTLYENVEPLTLQPGANTIYVSSNGASTADGTVDASLQVTLGGKYDTI